MERINLNFREKTETDNDWVESIVSKLWGSKKILSKDKIYEVVTLPGFITEQNNQSVGFILYAIEGNECEIVAVYSAIERRGIGTKLIRLVKEIVKKNNCKRIWLQTTNDNTQALRFYQKREFIIAAIRPNAIEAQRKIKHIPLVGNDGIPIRDEIELELLV